MQFPVIGGFDISLSREWQYQDTINWYVVNDPTAKTPQSLTPMPGTELVVTLDLDDDAIRPNGLYEYDIYYYAVAGENVWKVNAFQQAIRLFSLETTAGYISWSNNTTQLAIVDSVNLWIYNFNTGVSTKVDLSAFPPNPQMIYYQDARFVLSFPNSNQYFYSAQGDGLTWDINNFIVQQSRPDTSQGISGTNERLFLFGKVSTEIWAPVTYASVAPFYRDNNFIYEFGLAAKASVIKGVIDNIPNQPVINFVWWLATNVNGQGSFVICTGGTPVRASNDAVDNELAGFDVISDCACVAYKESGHLFIECSFLSANKTLFYDVNTSMWFHKERLDGTYSTINSHVFFNNKHYVGSRFLPQISQLSHNYLTDNGNAIKHTRITQTLIDENFNWLEGYKFEVDCESGQVASGQEPFIFISVSGDSGRTWGNPFKCALGEIGQYKWKTFIEGLGTNYSYTFKLEIFDPVRCYVFGASFNYGVTQQ